MSALPRLLEDPSTSEKLRADLRQAQAHTAAPFDTTAGLLRLRDGMKAGGGPTTPPGGAALPGSSWKLFAALGVAGVVGWALLSGGPESRELQVVAVRSKAVPMAQVEDKPETVSAKLAPKHGDQPSVAVESKGARAGKLEPVQVPSSRTAAPDKSDPFADEIAHLGALRQLHRKDPASAIAFAGEGHEKFPQGLLYEEREALLILSLNDAGRLVEAQRRAEGFRARFPRSAFLSKMERMAPRPEEPLGATE